MGSAGFCLFTVCTLLITVALNFDKTEQREFLYPLPPLSVLAA